MIISDFKCLQLSACLCNFKTNQSNCLGIGDASESILCVLFSSAGTGEGPALAEGLRSGLSHADIC